MDSHDILAREEALDFDRAFRAELDEITHDPEEEGLLLPQYYRRKAVADSLAAESPTGYLCSGCQGHATHYAPSAFYMVAPNYAPLARYPWCLTCRDLVLLTAHEALARMGQAEDYDDFAQEYLSESAIENMLAGPLTRRALDTFNAESNYHRLDVLIPRSFECNIVGCTRMQAITLCPEHAQKKHQKAVVEQQQAAVRADRIAAGSTPGVFLAAIGLPLWLISDPLAAGLVAGLAALVALNIVGCVWSGATDKHRWGRPELLNHL